MEYLAFLRGFYTPLVATIPWMFSFFYFSLALRTFNILYFDNTVAQVNSFHNADFHVNNSITNRTATSQDYSSFCVPLLEFLCLSYSRLIIWLLRYFITRLVTT